MDGTNPEFVAEFGQEFNSDLLDCLPVALMTCRMSDFVIDYANPASIELLTSIEHLLPIPAIDIVGQSIDIFHKNPAYQRRLLSDPAKLPHRAQISLGEEILDLDIHPYKGKTGTDRKAALVWNVVTEKLAVEKRVQQAMQMLDRMPVNVMLCDPKDDFKVTYANNTSLETLRRIEEHLPIKADELVGRSIDVFHKNPSHQRTMLSDPSNLPHQTRIKVGPETLKLKVDAIMDDDGNYVGPMLSWAIITDVIEMATGIKTVVTDLGETSKIMESSSHEMLNLAEGANEMINSVSSAAEEMSVSTQTASEQVARTADLARKTAEEAEHTDQLVRSLEETGQQIAGFSQIIKKISDQTRLLSLNATIEAARAGEAGRGFAVVAGEVKSLAGQTGKATEDIAAKVEEVNTVSANAAQAVRSITKMIQELSGTAMEMAEAVKQQKQASDEVSQTLIGVSRAAEKTGDAARIVNDVAQEVGANAGIVKTEITGFMSTN